MSGSTIITTWNRKAHEEYQTAMEADACGNRTLFRVDEEGIVRVPGSFEFNGRPLVDELRRLAKKNPGDCEAVMDLAADALESGVPRTYKGRTLGYALDLNLRAAMGDSKAAIHAALDALSSMQ